ncbi:unnamed protein product [Agarophyton chilense]|eukprot:gb/GEZJ01003726.1/.p1 GENE.gb/GEZJ01003726.1/~~gb/GEZJ01003726.1/.p1  ORF type:complete len:1162 (-),score=163.49 gb/GEZJ01003726.1/:88-3573(-)
MNSSKVRVGPTEASSGRLLILEVTLNPDVKILRTVDLAHGRQLTIALCEDWMSSDVKQGDVVRIILTHPDGTFQTWDTDVYQSTNPVLVTNELHFFVHHPDTLVSATSVADSFFCLRKAVISHRSPSGMPQDSVVASEAAVFGNLIHDMFQFILASDSSTRDYTSAECVSQTGGVDTLSFFEAVEDVLDRNYESLYAAEVLDQNARRVLHKVIPNIIEWYKVFMGSGNYTKTSGGLVQDGKSSHNVIVKEIHDIEELIWSPILGLKGKIDASVLFRIDGVDTGVGVFELKTGNSLGYSAISHSAQTALYTLLMSDRNSQFVKHSLLTYIQYQEALRAVSKAGAPNADHDSKPMQSKMKSKTIQGGHKNRIIIPVRGEFVGLMMQRNRLASFLRTEASDSALPSLLKGRPDFCSKCFANGSCMTQYKLLERFSEQDLSEGPGIELYNEKTSHITREHEEYYKFWRSLLAEEEMSAGRFSKEVWTLESHKREEEGRCLSSLALQPTESSSFLSPHQLLVPGTTMQAVFVRHAAAKIQPDLTKAGLAKGDYVVISAEHVSSDKFGFSRQKLSSHTWQCGLTQGFIVHLDTSTVSVTVGRSLSAWVSHQGLALSKVLWRIDREDISSSHNTPKRTIENLFCDKDNAITSRLRELIVDGREPIFLSREEAERKSGLASSELMHALNADQKAAVEMSLRANDYLLILGMPGTGKTTTLATIVLAHASQGKSVLLCSHTNTAVDNLLTKLMEHGFNDFIRLGRNLDVIDARVRENHVSKFCRPRIGTEQLEKDLDAPRVIATTCLGINHAVLARRTEFDLVVVDEASQILQPICIGPLQFARSAFILVGDHYQLPPLLRSSGRTGHSASRKARVKRESCSGKEVSLRDVEKSQRVEENESLFRRLCIRHPEAMVSLSMQYRMAGDIMDLSNELVYCGSLRCGTKTVESQALDIPKGSIRKMHPWLEAVRNSLDKVVFLDTGKIEEGVPATLSETTRAPESTNKHRKRSGDKAQRDNEIEASIVLESVRVLVEGGVPPKDITVLSPFRAQVHLLRDRLSELVNSNDHTSGSCQVFTVDQYQGKDNRCILVSFVRGKKNPIGPLLHDWRRINVAITRAKEKLILIGSAETLAKGSFFLEKMICWLRNRNSVYSVSAIPEMHEHLENTLLQ